MWKPLSIVASLLMLLTYLLVQSRNLDLPRRARMQEALQALHLHDTELTRDVLLARAGLLPDYDSLPRLGQQLARTVATLRDARDTASGDAAEELGAGVEAIATALRKKLTLVEHFTSENALLQNSLMYVTYAGTYAGGGPGAAARVEGPAAAQVAAFSRALLRFMHTPDPGASRQAEALLARLSHSLLVRGDLKMLVAHGRLIVKVLPEVDSLLHQIIAVPTAAHADVLQDALLQYGIRIEARAQLFQALLYLVTVVLLGYVVYQFARLRANALSLGRANRDLTREMSERQQAVAALRASEERFRAITESASDAIISADSMGNIVSWNARSEAIFGYPAGEILGAPLTRLMPSRYHAAHQQRFAAWGASGHSRLIGSAVEFSGARKDGSEFPLEVSLSTWSTSHGRYVTGIVRDLTAHKALQETTRQQELQLIQANKMTALGTLVSGVAHEIHNPNQAVLLNSGMLARAWDDAVELLDAREPESGGFSLAGLPYAEMRDTIAGLVREVRDSALRIERIVQDLKDFARPRARGARSEFQLNEAVRHALRLLAYPIRNRTDHLLVKLAEGMPSLRGDAQHVEQIAVNLITNAVEALPHRTSGVTVTTSFDPGARDVLLEVRDEGVGISPAHLARLCDPFFTTKQESGGTGLGLAITSSLVRLHGGRLTFESEPGKGTRALVAFPCPP